MNNLARQKLFEIVTKYGRDVCEDPRRVRALLSDHCPGLKREVNVLTGAVDKRVVHEMLHGSNAIPWAALAGRLTNRLINEAAMEKSAALWAVATWGMALGKLPRDKEPGTEDGPLGATKSDESIPWAQAAETIPLKENSRPKSSTREKRPQTSRNQRATAEKISKPHGASWNQILMIVVVLLTLCLGTGATGWVVLSSRGQRQPVPEPETPTVLSAPFSPKTKRISLRMKRTDALDFAQKVLEVIDIVDKNHYKEVSKGDMVNWAITGLYKSSEEKIPEEMDAKLRMVKTLKTMDLVELLTDARVALGVREDLEKHRDIDITLVCMLSLLDSSMTYVSPDNKSLSRDLLDGNFAGIGIQMRKDAVSDMLTVITPLKGSPAYKAGLEAGDIITTITREMDSQGEKLLQPEVVFTKGMPLNDAIKKTLGLPGTKVRLTVQREGLREPKEFEITRGRILTESVLGFKRKTNDDWDYWIDPSNKIAYIRLTVFQKNTAGDLVKVMKEMKDGGIKGLVLDLRFNSGGLLDSAVKITDLYIDDGLIVSIRPRNGKPYEFKGMREGSLTGFPMVCLINGSSASGSEIVSAALQDHSRAYLMGERSSGTGSLQNNIDFDGGDLTIATATLWRPSGKNLNKSSTAGKDEDEWGVKPDREVKLNSKERGDLQEALRDAEIIQPKGRLSTKEAKPELKDKQLEEALKYLRGQIRVSDRRSMN